MRTSWFPGAVASPRDGGRKKRIMTHPSKETSLASPPPEHWEGCRLARSLFGLGIGLFGLTSVSLGQVQPLPDEISRFLSGATPAAPHRRLIGDAAEPARATRAADGYLRYVGTPPGYHFPPASMRAAEKDLGARDFVMQHAQIFGITDPAVDLIHLRTRSRDGRQYVRLQQTVAGVPVFAAEITVQIDSQGGVESVLSDIARDIHVPGDELQWTEHRIGAEEAVTKAVEAALGDARGTGVTTTPPELTVFAPSVLGEAGPHVMVWELTLATADLAVEERFLIDTRNGTIVRRFPLQHSARDREIYDANNGNVNPGTLVRSEGDGSSSIADADAAYDFFGDAYAFYLLFHGRDSIDGNGMAMSATVRYCGPPDTPGGPLRCPPKGLAFWSNHSQRMYFGTGYVAEDVTGHELTHGVTSFTSGLVYSGVSGAINESFSDAWGEWIDLLFGPDNNNTAVRWLIGQNIPGGALRSMEDPPLFNDPDRVGSSLYDPNGGVHTNSGVNNKLVYLLTDGDTFNGHTISGIGITRAADLYYEVNANIITSGADWTDLFDALQQAAVNLAWSVEERNNLYRGCAAVEIASAGRDIYVDNSALCASPDGQPSCGAVFGGPYFTVTQGANSAQPGDTVHIRGGTYAETMTLSKILTLDAFDASVLIH